MNRNAPTLCLFKIKQELNENLFKKEAFFEVMVEVKLLSDLSFGETGDLIPTSEKLSKLQIICSQEMTFVRSTSVTSEFVS